MSAKPRYRWVVIYRDGATMDVPVASGAREACQIASHNRWGNCWGHQMPDTPNAHRIAEVRKIPTAGSGLVYRRYTCR